MSELKRECLGEGPTGGIVVLSLLPETADGRVLTNHSGKILRRLLSEQTVAVRLEPIIQRSLAKGETLLEGNLPNAELTAWYLDTLSRLEQINPRVIVTLGEDATRLLLNEPGKDLSDSHCYVHKIRLHGRDVPVVIGLSPLAIYSEPENEHWLCWALRKAKSLAWGRGVLDDPINAHLAPSFQEAMDWLRKCHKTPTVSVDIEATRINGEITCIGFATSPSEVMTIPFAKRNLVSYWSAEEEAHIWRAIAQLMADEAVEKIFQNYIFDTMCMRRFGIETKGNIYDTLVVAGVLNPDLPKSLADLARIYCNREAWKGTQDYNLTGDPAELWLYNAKDSACTYQIAVMQSQELESRGFTQFYKKYVEPLYHEVLATSLNGINIDAAALEAARQRAKELLVPIREELAALAAPFYQPVSKKPFNPASEKQVKVVLTAMGYRIPTKAGRQTTGTEALLKLYQKKPTPLIKKLLEHAKVAKLQSSYLANLTDPDGKVRYCYILNGTESGRLACKKTAWKTGLNIQTIPRAKDPIDIKSIFIPSMGRQFVQIDLSQAELRVVAWLSGEQTLIDMLSRKEDIHSYMASRVSEMVGFEVSRQLGKQINHSSNYGVGAARFSAMCLTVCGIDVSVEQASKLLAARNQIFPQIRAWQQSIEREVRNYRKLRSPHGREKQFFGPLDDSRIREALSFIPQATVVDTINRLWILMSGHLGATVPVQCHDSLLFEVPTQVVEPFLRNLSSVASHLSFDINGVSRLIPWDIQVGDSWGSLKPIS